MIWAVRQSAHHRATEKKEKDIYRNGAVRWGVERYGGDGKVRIGFYRTIVLY